MRYFLAVILSATLCATVGQTACAEEAVVGLPIELKVSAQVVTLELIQAHREYQQAKLRRHEYRFVTLPQQRRQLDNQVRFTEAEIAVLRRRLRDYRPFLQVGQYSPVRTAAENHQLALVAAEQRLRQLKNEQIGLLRLTRQNNQLYQLDVLQAATRLTRARANLKKTRPADKL